MTRKGWRELLLSGSLPGVGPDYGAIRRGGVAFVVIGAAFLGVVVYALPQAVHDPTLDASRVGLIVSSVVLGASLVTSVFSQACVSEFITPSFGF